MNKYRKKPLIIDGDPGHDDAIALVLAAGYKDEFDIKAITACAGNQTLEKTTINYRKIAKLLGLDNIPIGIGRDRPLMQDLIIAPMFHGESGLDGYDLNEMSNNISDLSAPDLIAKVLEESDEKVIILATGPQTNIAAVLLAHPELKEKIELISIMGGGLQHGNYTCSAEFNILVDPESAQIEFESGVPILMCPLDVTEKAMIEPEEWEEIRMMDNKVAKCVCGWLDFYYKHLNELGFSGAALHDPCSIMALVHPEYFTFKEIYVQVDTQGQYTRGATVPDYYGLCQRKPNIKAVIDVDRKKFVSEIVRVCSLF